MASANKMFRLKYSCEEVYERMDKGLCIFCEELDSPGHHQLKHKGVRIVMTECDDDQVFEDKEEAHRETVTYPNPSIETVTNPEPLVETLKNSGPFIESLKRASVLQVPDSFCDVLLVHKLDSHVKEVEELSQESTNGNDKIVAHQLFDQMPNEYQKDLTVISNKEVLSFSHKDDRVWEPGGVPNQMDLWDWPKGESKPHKKKSHQIETFEVLSSLEPSQFDITTIADAVWIAKRCESSLLQHSSATKSRAPFNPYQNYNNQPYYERKFGKCLEIEFDRKSDEIKDEKLQDKQPEDENFGVDKSVDMIREETSTLENESSPEVSPQILLSQFQVSLSSLEPGRRYHKESLVVVNDLSSDLGCVIGKTHEFNYDPERGQDNSLYEEEFKGFKLGKQSKNEKWLNTVCLLGLMDMSCWTQFSSLLKANEMPLGECDQWKWSEKQRTYNRAWKFKYIQRFMLSALLQNEQHKLLQGRNIKCKMKKMEVLRRLKQIIFIEVQFHMENNSERMLLELINCQAKTRDAEIETTLIDKDTFQKPLEEFYRAGTHDYMALRVLELIKDRASRKRKLCKNWWFKYKLNTWLSEALHFWRKRKYVKLQRASEHTMCELIHNIRKACQCVIHETSQAASQVWYWWKTKTAIVQTVLTPIMHLKGKEKTFSFNIAVKSCSMFCFSPYSTWMVSQNRHASSSCTLRQEEKYVPVLFTIAEALTLFNDQHTLVAEKNGSETSIGCCYGLHADLNLMADVTASISMDEFSSVCKLLFGVFVLNLIADQVRDWSFFGLLLQWKWHPPPQATSEFHQAHNNKPVFHL